jgi:hypothetical protein
LSPILPFQGFNINITTLADNGFKVMFEMKPSDKLNLILTNFSTGLPAIKGYNMQYPDGFIPAQARSNTT